MKTHNFKSREEWELFRRGKLTGSRVKDLVVKRGTEEKIGYYEIIAERLAIKPDGENAMARGSRLEDDAIARFAEETKKKVNTDLIMWSDDEIPNIAISPDGYVIKGKKITEAVEAKCLASSRHVETLIKQKIPKEYEDQVAWYFVVNQDLETLYMCFFDPRMIVHDFFFLTIKREDYEENQLENLKVEMAGKLASIDEQVAILTKGSKLEF